MGDESEVRSVLTGQAEGIPAHPDDEISLVGTLLAEPVQARRTGKIAVADADLAWDGSTALDRLASMPVGQFEMRKAAASKVVDRMQPPTGRLAARLAKATAIAGTQGAAGPMHGCPGALFRQLVDHHRVEEFDRLVEAILHRWIAHLGDAQHTRPSGGFAQRQAARTTRQCQAQKISAATDHTLALDRPGLPGEAVEIKISGKSPQQFVKLIRREGCCRLHLPQNHTNPRRIKSYFNAYDAPPPARRAGCDPARRGRGTAVLQCGRGGHRWRDPAEVARHRARG